MKTKQLPIALAVALTTLGFASCKKSSDSSSSEIETTYELSTDQAISDNLVEDANDVFSEAAVQSNVMGAKGSIKNRPEDAMQTMGILSCATVTVTPTTPGVFPKNMTIDFGTGCTSANGVYRKGIINIVLSGPVRTSGSTAVMTFDNYYVNGYKKEGTITWTNTSTGTATKSWQRKVENGKITSPSGKYWLHSGIKDVVQTDGVNTPNNLLDDVFSITGNHTVTNSNNVTRTCTIISALEKKTICENIDKGSIRAVGPNHTAVIDFGNGVCDKLATISVDGGTPRTILLR